VPTEIDYWDQMAVAGEFVNTQRSHDGTALTLAG
jgi:hypothetical protein